MEKFVFLLQMASSTMCDYYGLTDPYDKFIQVTLKKKDYIALVNQECVKSVIQPIARLCLEYDVNNRNVDRNVGNYIHPEDDPVNWSNEVHQIINNYLKDAKEKRSTNWLDKHGKSFEKRYTESDIVNLMEIIPRVSGIRQNSPDKRRQDLWGHLTELKRIRNFLSHVEKYASSKLVVKNIYDIVDKIYHVLRILYSTKSDVVENIKKNFQKKVQKMTGSQQTVEEKVFRKAKLKQNINKMQGLRVNDAYAATQGIPEASSICTGTAGLYRRAALVRPCKCTTWRQSYLTRNPLFGRATKDEQLFDWLSSGEQMTMAMLIIYLLAI